MATTSSRQASTPVIQRPSRVLTPLVIALALASPACGLSPATAGQDAGAEAPGTSAPAVRGSNKTFEIATWNLEHFPKADDATVERVTAAVQTLKLDVIAVQELADTNAFHDMVGKIPGWRSISAGRYDINQLPSKYNPPVGIMFDSRSVVLRDKYLLFAGESNAFPRSPLAVDIEWSGIPLTIIVVHLKAMGDNVISNDPNDEEARRKRACDLLASYIDQSYAGRGVIVLGDFNDKLGEPPESDVFQALDSRPDRFYFVDMDIALHGGFAQMSYPPYQSHIDHILITSELFPAFFTDTSDVQTLTVEGFLENGWFEYAALVSDHRPVYTRLDLDKLEHPSTP